MALDEITKKIIVQALDIESLPQEDQAVALERAGILIYQSIITRAMEEMTDEAVDEFEKVVEGGPTPEAMLTYFHEKIPNFNKMIEEETKKYIEFTQKMTKLPE